VPAHLIVLLVIIGLSPSVVGQQGAGSAAPQGRGAEPVSEATVMPTKDGDFTITYAGNGGQRSFTFVPATKSDPSLVVQVIRDPKGGGYTYRYRLSNGQKARQRLAEIKMTARGLVASAAEAPRGWRADVTASRDLLMWSADVESDGKHGLGIGNEVSGFEITSSASYLPGPTQAACRGDATSTLPADLPPGVRTKLERSLLLRDFLSVPTLAPSIPAGDGEIELTPDVLTARVAVAYSYTLSKSEHRSRTEVIATLKEAVELLSSDKKAGAAALERARALALGAGPDEWSQSLGQGLALCIDFIKARFAL
jgi:hypothetical protein